jgi:transposase
LILGIKRHVVIDANGHPLNFTLSRANRNDQINILETIDGIRVGKRRRRPKRLSLDKGYDSDPLRQQLRQRKMIPVIAYRKNRVKKPKGRPALERRQRRDCRQRWKVERTFAWINNAQRLDRLLERSQRAYRAWMRVFFIKYYLDLLYTVPCILR